MTQLVADLGNVGIMQNQSVMIHSRLDFRVLGTHMMGNGPRMDLGQSSRRGQVSQQNNNLGRFIAGQV
jgi:hypothetical protein